MKMASGDEAHLAMSDARCEALGGSAENAAPARVDLVSSERLELMFDLVRQKMKPVLKETTRWVWRP